MESICPGFPYVIDVCSSQAAILAGIAVGDHRSFPNIVLAQHQVGGAAIVQLEQWIHIVHPIESEKV